MRSMRLATIPQSLEDSCGSQDELTVLMNFNAVNTDESLT